MLRVPLTAEDLEELHDEIERRGLPEYQRALLQCIFGDSYLIRLADILLSVEDPAPGVVEPVEKLLMMTASDKVRRFLLDVCFGEGPESKVENACLLLVSTAAMSLWGDLARFAGSQRVPLQRCGVAILDRLVSAGLPSAKDGREALSLFRGIQDDYVRELVSRIEAELMAYPEPS